MIRTLHEGFLADGIAVPLAKLCAWFGVPRRTVYCKPTKAAPKVDPRFADPIKAMIEKEASFGYRTVAWLLGFNKNTVQRIFQIKGWQVRKRSIGMRPRIEAIPSVATGPNECWSTDLCRVWSGRDGWTTLALVIDCHTRELLGWQPRGRLATIAKTVERLTKTLAEALGDPDAAAKVLDRAVTYESFGGAEAILKAVCLHRPGLGGRARVGPRPRTCEGCRDGPGRTDARRLVMRANPRKIQENDRFAAVDLNPKPAMMTRRIIPTAANKGREQP